MACKDCNIKYDKETASKIYSEISQEIGYLYGDDLNFGKMSQKACYLDGMKKSLEIISKYK